MYPHFHPYSGFRFRRPSRLIWFTLGGLAATWWHYRHYYVAERNFGHCRRLPMSASTPAPEVTNHSAENVGSGSGDARRAEAVSQQGHGIAWPTSWASQREVEWEQDKERLRALGTQAADTMTDLSEATLDSVLSTVEALKVKLAEHKAQREQQQKAFEEEQRRFPRRMV